MTASRADARNMRAAVEDGHAAKIRLAAGIVATAFLGAIGAGVTPKDIAAALDREAGSNDAARVAMGRLREVAGELAALVGAPVSACGFNVASQGYRACSEPATVRRHHAGSEDTCCYCAAHDYNCGEVIR